MPHHRVNPATRAAARRIEGRGFLPNLQEPIVHGFVSEIAPAQDTVRDSQEPACLALINFLQLALVPACAGHQCAFVVEFIGLH